MIEGCFRHIRGIGPKTEAALRKRGLHSWQDCLARSDDIPFNGSRRTAFLESIRRSMEAVSSGDIGQVTSSFPTSEQWRILAEYFNAATFIDIETTGISWHGGHISVITALRGDRLHAFVHGENLDDFLDLADEAPLLVSFNGTSFDIPFLERTFHVPSICRAHIDVRWIAWHRGLRGGLKAIERAMGIRRPPEIEGIDGLEAVELYYRWKNGDSGARDTLIRYCKGDAIATRLVVERLLPREGSTFIPSEPARLFSMIQ